MISVITPFIEREIAFDLKEIKMKKTALLASLASFGFDGIAQANPAGTSTLAVGAANIDPPSSMARRLYVNFKL